MHAAYNDSAGITASFNKNLLVRINRELGGHFEPDAFCHVSFWNEAASRIELHLESTCRQSVRVDALDTTLQFYQGERIHTKIAINTRSSAWRSYSSAAASRLNISGQIPIAGSP